MDIIVRKLRDINNLSNWEKITSKVLCADRRSLMDVVDEWIKQGRKTWIQQKNKGELIEIANKLAQQEKFLDSHSIDEIRRYLREYVDARKTNDSASSGVIMASITSLEIFAGENWIAYQQQFECFILLNDVPEEKKVPLLITKLSTSVYDLLTTLCTPTAPVKESYENICEKLKKHYHPVKNYALHQAEFRKRCQKPNETIDQYVVELKKLSKNCNFKSLDEEIKERLLNGTYYDSVKFELLKQADQSLDILMNIGKTVETAYKLAFNHEKEQEQTQMFHLEKKNINRNKPGGFRQNTSPLNKQNVSCFCCGKNGHMKLQCSLREKFCSECGVKGHIFKVCAKNKSLKVKNVNLVETTCSENVVEDNKEVNCTEDTEVFDIFYFSDKNKVPSATLQVNVNGKIVEFVVDTGADVSTITLADKQIYFPDLEIKQCNVIFTNFDRSTSTPVGVIENLNVGYQSVNVNNQRLFVVKNGLPKIIGKDWLALLQLWPPRFDQKICEGYSKDKLLNIIKNQYSELFEPGMGNFTGEPIHLSIEPDAKPIFMPVRTVPFALKNKVKEEIKRLVENKRIEPVEYAAWGTPVVPVIKPDGTVRLCGDFRVTINKYLQIDHFPLPTINDMLNQLQGNSYFCELDLKEAYLQAPLDKPSQELVTIVTEEGIFKYLYLPFGVSTGPGSFQRLITKMLNGLGVIVYIDNIYIYGETLADTYEKLKLVLQRLQESGIKLKLNKCKFFEEKLDIFGFEVNRTGIKVIRSKLEPLLSLPRPKNIKMLRSFLGKVNYYNRFLQNMAIILKPLYDCLKKSKLEWTEECDCSFQEIKKALANTTSLSHFEEKSTIILTCDSADCGVAAVLSVADCNNIRKPVAFASKKLNETQMKYPILEKEAFAIVFGVSKFYEYLFGHKFILETDNEALTKILGPKHGIPKMAARRLQYWSIFLSGFNYEIKHIKSKNNPADYLSRVVTGGQENSCEVNEIINKSFESNTVNYINASNLNVLNWKTIQNETKNDKILCDVLRYCRDGWPEKNDLGDEYESYFRKKNEISLEKECLLWGYRVIIPKNVRANVMQELHASHLGINRMKEISRSYFWWPEIDKDIEDITSNCINCLQNHKNPVKNKLTMWPQPPSVWHRIHADFLGPLYSKMFLVIVDAYSKWPEAFIMNNITAQKTIEVFKSIFVRYGYPLHLVTDNGPTWTSEEFKCFCKVTGIKQSFSPPYHPATNGLAERFVESFKSHVTKIVESGKKLEYACNLFLFDYRCTNHKTTGQSPAKLMLGRELRCRFSLLRPSTASTNIDFEQVKLTINSKNNLKFFSVGQKVMAQDMRKTKKKWALGKIYEVIVPGVTYVVEVDGLHWKRHANQLIQCSQDL